MPNPPNLLNDDGSASMATLVMMSHHAFRRDLARFAKALGALARGDTARATLLHEQWQSYQAALHGHHEIEDTRIFPHLKSTVSAVAATIDRLTGDHRLIDPLLARGERAFAELPNGDAAAMVAELRGLLEPHLALEEAEVVPHLRAARAFPPPANDDEAALYAQGFAWSTHGVHQDVLNQVYTMLPESVISRLPAARVEFEARCVRVWGSAQTGASRTPIPVE